MLCSAPSHPEGRGEAEGFKDIKVTGPRAGSQVHPVLCWGTDFLAGPCPCLHTTGGRQRTSLGPRLLFSGMTDSWQLIPVSLRLPGHASPCLHGPWPGVKNSRRHWVLRMAVMSGCCWCAWEGGCDAEEGREQWGWRLLLACHENEAGAWAACLGMSLS